ncbi:bifunctional glycosyltransferase/CDP-glycerol:glycerophosphate glycerophosphotransferase [Leuconostoc sp.]|uniref:bifunctional glycosyltransferase/CDP-glycerol:glycerophosphate glycerophosphotransferase n=1 Tax=Leuconostoc sp. TaxID=1930076 RepID=UPI0029588BFA|nr:CDP-glycerol glycerophosphotransferase family protein [Leuconostoc sp.]MDV8936248.1 bifunctional glycosyltransferase family 2 protein/CDP-glycerol:glycerophosphate glycerophosphotransferase [Leuconostoc sp.]
MAKKKLAVIVPMYNVKDFIVEALDSLLKQGLTDDEMQVILIDDGSKDNTLKIAQEYVKKHPKLFEAYSFENGGLGASRNRGTRMANAEYITYLDPDDIIIDGSYHKALDILSETESDILVAGTKRFNSKRVWDSWIHSRSGNKDLRQTTFAEHPELVWDSTAWNKLYKLDFIRENNLYTPEGILYEDMPMVVPSLTLAKSIDVMSDTMYMWRSRDFGAPSITQMSSNNPKPLIDRLFAMGSILDNLNKYNAASEIVDAQIAKFVNFDVMVMYAKDKFDLFALEDKASIFAALKKFLNKLSLEQLASANFHDLVYFDRVLNIPDEDVKRFSSITLSFLRGETSYVGEWINGKYTLKSDLSDLKKIATEADFKVMPKVENVYKEGDAIIVEGYAVAKMSDMSDHILITDAHVSLTNQYDEVVRESVGSIEFVKEERLTSKFGYNQTHFVRDIPDFNYDYGRYILTLPIADLETFDEDGNHVVGTFGLKLNFTVDGQTLSTPLKNPVPGTFARPEKVVSPTLHTVVEVTYDTANWALKLTPEFDIATLRVSDDNELFIENGYERVELVFGKWKMPLMQFDGRILKPNWVAEKMKRYSDGARGNWEFHTENSEGEVKSVYYAGHEVRFDNDVYSEYILAEQGKAKYKWTWLYPIITQLEVENEVLNLEFELNGWLNEAIKIELLLDKKLPDIVLDTIRTSDNTYSISVPLTLDGFGDKTWLNIAARLTYLDGYETTELIRFGPHEFQLKNEHISAGGVEWYFYAKSGVDYNPLAIKRTADRVYTREIGGLDRFMQDEYQEWTNESLLNDTIVWAAYWGKENQFHGNPGALYQYAVAHYPHLKHVIVLADAIRSYPEYGKMTKVISFNTKDYWYYMARARYFVNDVNFEETPRKKRENQIEIQTMHGTPLKKMGFEVLNEWSDRSYPAYQKRNSNWDYLVVPSDFVAEVAKNAYNVSPKLLKTGYPRNDVLFESHSEIELSELKQTNGLPLNKKIVLYAPTWHDRGETEVAKYLNVESLYDAIPNDTLVLLKPHPFENWTKLDSKYADKFAYAPTEITTEKLYLLSDAVITDYSSVMFDYALLDKPMMFFTFDYDEYIEKRGFNFDLKVSAPGPVLMKQTELEDWLSRIEDIPLEFADKIASFKQQFGQYDKGNASEQIAKQIWG